MKPFMRRFWILSKELQKFLIMVSSSLKTASLYVRCHAKSLWIPSKNSSKLKWRKTVNLCQKTSQSIIVSSGLPKRLVGIRRGLIPIS